MSVPIGPAEDGAEPGEQDEPDQLVIDAIGLRCPLPIIRLATAARSLPAGTVITLLSTDPAAEPDVAAWCRMRGHDRLDQEWVDATLRSRVRLG